MTSMWRFADRLPVAERSAIVSLGEGGTPVIDASAALGPLLGVASVHLKAEDRNPTGSFKARIASVAYSLVRERGLRGAVGTSSGNGGAAAAAYAAAAGSRAIMFTLSDTLPAKLAEIVAVGGTAYRVHGVGHDAASTVAVAQAIATAAHDHGFYPMLTGFRFAPEAMAGVKTIAWELREELPDTTAVYAPVGGGGLVTGLHAGFVEDGHPVRIVGVHPAGASALVAALAGDHSGMRGSVDSTVSGLQMAVLYDSTGAAAAVTESGGHARAVSDAEIHDAQRLLATRLGLLVEPAGATAVAGMLRDAAEGRLDRDDRVVGVLTGAGYKDSAALARLAPPAAAEVIEAAQVGDALGREIGGRG